MYIIPSQGNVGNVIHVYHYLAGHGRVGLLDLSAAMGARELTTYTFNLHAQYLYKEMDTFYREQEGVMKECIDGAYEKQEKERDEDKKLNADCSFDGTWLNRGHQSKIGAAFVMEISSGMVIDFEVLSYFCRACAIMGKKKKKLL